MSSPPQPLNALRAFEAVARHLSVKRAAAELNVTPAAISHQIKLLEELVGQPLFRRRPRRIELTEAGRAGLPKLSAGFGQLGEGLKLLRETATDSALAVSVAPSFASCWLMPRMHRFLTDHPTIDVRVTARTRQSTAFGRQAKHEAEAWLSDADVAILLSNGEFPGLHAECLLPLSVTPLGSPRLLRRRFTSPTDLLSHTLIHDDMGKHFDGRDFWGMWLAAAGAGSDPFRHGARFSHTVLALDAAAEGAGIVATLAELAQPQLADKRLIAPFELRVPLRYAYYLIARPEALARAPVHAFLTWLRAQAAVPAA